VKIGPQGYNRKSAEKALVGPDFSSRSAESGDQKGGAAHVLAWREPRRRSGFLHPFHVAARTVPQARDCAGRKMRGIIVRALEGRG
jgi:hypothetical protein